MDTPEHQVNQPDTSSRRRRFARTPFLLGAVATLIVAALIVGVLARTGVIFTHRSASSTAWHTFHDSLDLFSLRLPPGWVANGGGRFGMVYKTGYLAAIREFLGEQYTFENLRAPAESAEIVIYEAPFTDTAAHRQTFCTSRARGGTDTSTTFDGMSAVHILVPVDPYGQDGWGLSTEYASFGIYVMPQAWPSDLTTYSGPPPTGLSPAQIAANQAEALKILATFRLLDTKPIAC